MLITCLFTFLCTNRIIAQWIQTTGLENRYITTLAVSGRYLFVGTDEEGVFVSTDDGTSWTLGDTDLTITNVRSLVVSGTGLFAGTGGYGVWLSSNNGTRWSWVGLAGTYVWSLGISGTNIYAGLNNGVFRSTDNGMSWKQVDSGLTIKDVSALLISGINIYAGSYNSGVFRSTDNGTSWTQINNGLSSASIYALAIIGTNLFAGTDSGLFRSTNNGSSWMQASSGIPNTLVMSFAVSGTNLFAGTFGDGVYISTDHGINWSAVNLGLTNTYIMSLVVSGTNLFAGTLFSGVYINKSLIMRKKFIQVVMPNGNENWESGTHENIIWNSDSVSAIAIDYSIDSGKTWNIVTTNTSATQGLLNWEVPKTQSTKCLVRIRDVSDSALYDISDIPFTISLPNTLALLSPNGGEIWPVGVYDTIKWNSTNISSVKIDYSTNEGNSWRNITLNTPASSGYYVWKVDTATSNHCKVKIQDVSNSDVQDTSDAPFTIVYWLTRSLSNGSYELFDLNKHTWSFLNGQLSSNPPYNNDPIMWPSYWWGRFNYDQYPYTSDKWVYIPWFWGKASQRFPDWSLFVDVFTEASCYNDPPPGGVNFKWAAAAKWASISAKDQQSTDPRTDYWRGSCFGFSLSAFLTFDDPQSFKWKFPEAPIGIFPNIHDYEFRTSDTTTFNIIRKIINHFQSTQYGATEQDFKRIHFYDGPIAVVETLKSMFTSPFRNDRIITIDDDRGNSHAVNPFRIGIGTTIDTIYVYDNSYPDWETYGMTHRMIYVGRSTNTWLYPYEPFNMTYGLHDGIMLREPISHYLDHPKINGSNYAFIKSVRASSDKSIELYNPPSTSIVIKNATGETIGYSNDSLLTNLPFAIPIIPITGEFSPPIGYSLPTGQYSIVMDHFKDSAIYINIFGDSTLYSFARASAESLQQDVFRINDGLSVVNQDSISKKCNLYAVTLGDSSCEKIYALENLSILKQDSLNIKRLCDQRLKVSNGGQSTKYDLKIIKNARSNMAIFEHLGITIDAGCSQIICPFWDSLSSEPVQIFIDNNSDGIIDDSLMVVNQVTGIDDKSTDYPSSYTLQQNYPNPFNPITSIHYGIPERSKVKLEIYNTLGQRVASLVDVQQDANFYTVKWNANVSSGVYFYRLEAISVLEPSKSFTQVKKMLLLK